MLRKAATLPADEIVVDLEDGVSVEEKTDETRARAVEAVRRGATGEIAIRINGLATPWWEDDLAAVVEAAPAAVVVPKVESAEDVAQVATRLPAGVAIEAQIETARGLLACERIAASGGSLTALVLGPGDLAASMGMPELTIGEGSLDYALARIAVAARAFGLQPIDGPWAKLGDLDGLRASARRSRSFGFEGKWVVHPDQIAPVEQVFTPTEEEIREAEAILASFAVAGTGAARLGGEMVDEATRKMAESVVRRGRTQGRALGADRSQSQGV
jgi:citrate lyase subunit beta/citryl-CoA lyase